jgi:uridine kinase
MASIDGWHNPRHQRLRRGQSSPEGYYQDSFNYAALKRRLLDPFAAGAPSVTLAAFDYRTESEVTTTVEVPSQAALIFDGVFLLRPELRDHWDLAIYLHVPERVTLERALVRDQALFGAPSDVEERYVTRYLRGQALYRSAAQPVERAHIVLDNSDPAIPTILKWQPPTR